MYGYLPLFHKVTQVNSYREPLIDQTQTQIKRKVFDAKLGQTG